MKRAVFIEIQNIYWHFPLLLFFSLATKEKKRRSDQWPWSLCAQIRFGRSNEHSSSERCSVRFFIVYLFQFQTRNSSLLSENLYTFDKLYKPSIHWPIIAFSSSMENNERKCCTLSKNMKIIGLTLSLLLIGRVCACMRLAQAILCGHWALVLHSAQRTATGRHIVVLLWSLFFLLFSCSLIPAPGVMQK